MSGMWRTGTLSGTIYNFENESLHEDALNPIIGG